MIEKKILVVGQEASFSKTITEHDVCEFAGITGDFNSIHIDEEKAKKSFAGTRIAHGLLVGGLISATIGTKLPGEGAVYLEQDLKFVRPTCIGDTCTATVTIVEIINTEKGIYKLDTVIKNQNNEEVIKGYAVVKYL